MRMRDNNATSIIGNIFIAHNVTVYVRPHLVGRRSFCFTADVYEIIRDSQALGIVLLP